MSFVSSPKIVEGIKSNICQYITMMVVGGYHSKETAYHTYTYTISMLIFVADFRAEVQKRLHDDQDYPCEVVGSWNTWYGEQDQAGKQQKTEKKCHQLLCAETWIHFYVSRPQ